MDAWVGWYQRKIGGYDLQIWEKAVEQREQRFKGINGSQKEESSLKTDLIDLDLVRGSTFSKNKPQLDMMTILRLGLIRVFFLPFFMKWWTQQTSKLIFTLFLFLYFLQIVISVCYISASEEDFTTVTPSELVLPGLLLIYLGIIHCQVVSTNFTMGEKRVDRKRSDEIPVIDQRAKSEVDMTYEDGKENSNLSSDSDESKNGSDNSSSGQSSRTNLMSYKNMSVTRLVPGTSSTTNKINIRLWENGRCHKVRASIVEIGSLVMKRADQIPQESYALLGLMFVLVIPFIPLIYRCVHNLSSNEVWTAADLLRELHRMLFGGRDVSVVVVMVGITVQRVLLGAMFFIMLCAAQRTFKRRFYFAKYFTHVTSSRRAKKSEVPHFRLKKVQNIMVWLSLRSYLQRRGPQRSIDVIVSSTFLCSIGLLCFITVQLMHSSDTFMSSLLYWECLVWLLALAVFLLTFITTGAKINKKYSNTSVLLTEQINLYLQMEKKPHKKDSFQRANNVLTLAAKLIKEIEAPFNIYGLSMNPILYNITRVIVLSAFSGVISELLGFKLKIWKIKT